MADRSGEGDSRTSPEEMIHEFLSLRARARRMPLTPDELDRLDELRRLLDDAQAPASPDLTIGAWKPGSSGEKD